MMFQLTQEIIQKKYNQGVFCTYISKNEELDTICKLGAVSPVEIIDNNSFTHLKFIKLNEVGKITLSEDKKIKFATDSKVINERITAELLDIRCRTENIVLASIHEKLVKIAMIRALLNPIYVILKDVYDGEITDNSLKGYPKKYEKYFKFLLSINMIRKSKNGYAEGNNFIQIKKHLSKENEELVLNKVFGYTISEGKYYLIDNLKLNILKPFIRLTTSFYTPSIQLKDKINMKKLNLFRKYINQYQVNTSYSKFEGLIDQLNRAEIINETKEGIYVIDKILDRINQNMLSDKQLLATFN